MTAVAALELQRQEWRERQRRCRAGHALASETAEGSIQDGEGNANADLRWGRRRHRTVVRNSSQRIANSIVRILRRIREPAVRAAVVQKVFSNPRVRPLLPDYYPSPEEARAQRDILQNFRTDLEALKVPHSSGKLARKRAILEAVVGDVDADISNFHNILGTRKQNLVAALDRLRSATTSASGRFVVPVRKKREGGLSEEVKLAVLLWWTQETRVSPQRRDVRRKRLGRNLYDTHAAHLLLESQVRHSSLRRRNFFPLSCGTSTVHSSSFGASFHSVLSLLTTCG